MKNTPKHLLLLLVCGFVILGSSLLPSHSTIFAGSPNIQDYYGYAQYSFHTLHTPTGVAVSSTGIYISDSKNNVIRMFSPTAGTLTTVAGNGTAGYVNGNVGSAEFNFPTGISAVTYAQRDPNVPGRTDVWTEVTVNDSQNSAIRGFCLGAPTSPGCGSTLGQVRTVAGTGSPGYVNGSPASAQFNSPTGIDPTGTVIADTANNALRTYSLTAVSTLASSSTPGYVNGPLANARFNFPTMAITTSQGSVIVDAGNHAIRLLNSSQQVSTLAGTGTAGYVDGPGSRAQFSKPTAILYNPADGYYYIADTFNNCIRRMDVLGNVTTYAGLGGKAGLQNGTATSSLFNKPTGIAVGNGYLYVADSGNNCIRRIDMTAHVVSTYIS